MQATAVDVYVFSGTGNTLLAARELVRALREEGVEAELRRLETSRPESVRRDRALGLAFPVAVQSTYPLVWKFVEGLPPGEGREVFMLDTLARFSGGAVGPLKRVLSRKGYACVGAREFVMPSNFGHIGASGKNRERIEKTLPRVAAYARDLVSGKTRWPRLPLFSDLVRLFSRGDRCWKWLGGLLAVDRDRCTRCGLCIRLCPVGALESGEDGYPRRGGACQSCMRCVSFCPASAVTFRGKVPARYRAVSAGELLGG
ncbi:MAG TPA: EFR1 family ferrodoxin [bacterium]|nr:EFR1 family ferrodoxin [bacterium]HPJ71505.1 EFR1 family ferrodoxin [bacterium]HPQ67137.1 EFR1 family ferrodoxin [bacterium]